MRLASLLAPLALLAAGCGWHAGYLAPPGAPNASTVGVELFGNDSPEPGLEADLAPFLSRALVDYVGLDLDDPRKADLVIRGSILDFRRRGGVRSEENELLEGSTRIEVLAELVRASDGEVLSTATTGLWADWAIGGPGLTGPGLGEDAARTRLFANLADRLVLDLFAGSSDENPETEPAEASTTP